MLAAGRYDIKDPLSLVGETVTLRGAGMDARVLLFRGRAGVAEGLIVTDNGAARKDFAIADTRGDEIGAKRVDGFAVIRVRVERTGGPRAVNGSYGSCPVQ